jgi:PAS domain S-box-containing protein
MSEPDRWRKGDDRYARIVALSPDAIIGIDAHRMIDMFNLGAERIFGYSASEIIGKPLSVLIPERFRARHDRHVGEFSAGPPSARIMGDRQMIYGLRRSGEEFPAEATISKIEENGGGEILTVILRDVSERVSIERQRRIETERLRQALEAGRMGSFENDLDSGQIRLMGHAAEILGLPIDQASEIDFKAVIVPMIHPDDREMLQASIAKGLQTGETQFAEYRITRPDGSQRWIRLIATKDVAHPERRRSHGIMQDITAYKDVQATLEATVAERTHALRDQIRQREDAEAQLIRAQRMEAYGQLTGGVAHDFNNLLTVIGGNLELLQDRITDERNGKLLGRALSAVEMGSRLTQRLLAFARRSRLEPEVLDLNEQVNGMLDFLKRTIGETISVSSRLAADLWPVRADPSEVENAILNLAINSRDAMPNGGRLIIETANVVIDEGFARMSHLEAVKPGDYARLSVTDTGAGMPPDVLARAFEPFFTTKESGKGTGLGLASIYGFARQSEGMLTIYSEVGKGTTVSLYLPRVDAEKVMPVGKPIAANARPAQRAILAVEDNDQVREVTVERLESLGYRVLACSGGKEAIEIIESVNDIDLVFSDVMMAGMSGFDLARWIASHRPAIRVLLTSGFTEEVARGAENLDAPSILRKPYATRDLERALADIWEIKG